MTHQQPMRIRCPRRRGLGAREAQQHLAVDVALPASLDVVVHVSKTLARCVCGTALVVLTGEEDW